MPVAETPDALVTEEFNRLRGRICGLVESWGLPDRQERGAISTFKSLSYDSQSVIIELIEDLQDQVLRLAADAREHH